jgi:hypothetical protein
LFYLYWYFIFYSKKIVNRKFFFVCFLFQCDQYCVKVLSQYVYTKEDEVICAFQPWYKVTSIQAQYIIINGKRDKNLDCNDLKANSLRKVENNISLSLSLSLSLLHIHTLTLSFYRRSLTHTHTHTHTERETLFLTISFSLSLSHTHITFWLPKNVEIKDRFDIYRSYSNAYIYVALKHLMFAVIFVVLMGWMHF